MAITAKEMARYLGRTGLLNTENGKLAINIRCHDVKQAFGRVDVLIAPIDGLGEVWVSEQRIAWEGM